MPSTTPERAALIRKWFGDSDFGYDYLACLVLEAQGFRLDKGGLLRPAVPSQSLTYEQRELILYLEQEWDYAFER